MEANVNVGFFKWGKWDRHVALAAFVIQLLLTNHHSKLHNRAARRSDKTLLSK